MSKKKTRAISVDDRSYRWRVTQLGPHRVNLRVWRVGERQPWADVAFPFDDPWLNFGPMLVVAAEQPERFHDVFHAAPITPGLVAEIIRRLEDQGLSGAVDGAALLAEAER